MNSSLQRTQKREQRNEIFQYLFGDEIVKLILARSFQAAAFEFRMTCPDPELYCRTADRVIGEDGRFIEKEHSRYESTYALKPEAKIPIVEKRKVNGSWESTGREWLLALSECIDVDYSNLNRVSALIGNSDATGGAEEHMELASKARIIAERNRLAAAVDKLNEQIFGLEQQIRTLNDQIREKRKILLGASIYNGTNCDCYCLLEGRPAPEGTKLSIYQEKLYVDEQIAVYSCRFGSRSFDYTNLDEFEDFLKASFKEFHYRPLSVVAWQIRRTEKNYGDALTTMLENQWNYMTAITIRNGEQLYIIYCDEFRIGDVLFPKAKELDAINERWKNIIRSTTTKEEEIRAYYGKYVFGLLLIQGILDRTDLLGNWNKGLNLIKGNDEQLELIRDAEPNFWLDDGHETFNEYITRNRESIKVGSRVLFTGGLIRNDFNSHWDDTLTRTGCRTVDWPAHDQVYIVNGTGTWHQGQTFYRFLYLPQEPLSWAAAFRKDDCSNERTRRIGFKAYDYELLNLDELKIEDIDYFLSNRKYRADYMRILPILSVAKKMLSREKEQDDNFKKFVKSNFGFEVSEEELDEAIEQFKLKKFKSNDERKWKRGLMDDAQKGQKACFQIKELIIYNRNRKRLLEGKCK